MKKFRLPAKDCNEDGLDWLHESCHDVDVVDNGNFWMCDFATGCRVLTSHDTLEITVTPEQETVLILRYGDKITELI